MELPQRHRERGVQIGIFWGSEFAVCSRLRAESSKLGSNPDCDRSMRCGQVSWTSPQPEFFKFFVSLNSVFSVSLW
jgi:hypothetical protein